jgi:hypothetical protein
MDTFDYVVKNGETIGDLREGMDYDMRSINIWNLSDPRQLDGILKYYNLQELGINYCSLESLPDTLYELTNLKKLYIKHSNTLKVISPKIGTMINLEHLQITDNVLMETIPVEIGSLIKLRVFTLCGNRLKSLPSSIGNLVSLTYFDCSNNMLAELPKTINRLYKLRYLDCSRNALTELPDLHMTNLPYLEFSINPLKRIPLLPLTLKSIRAVRTIFNDRFDELMAENKIKRYIIGFRMLTDIISDVNVKIIQFAWDEFFWEQKDSNNVTRAAKWLYSMDKPYLILDISKKEYQSIAHDG